MPTTTNDGIYRILNELELTRLGRLNMNSRYTVEGQLQGAHRSPLKGFSVEFADYRQYVAGDDLRHLDWRSFGRTERLYIRQYEEECNLRLYMLLDGSASMSYSHGDRPTKYRYASRLAAALAYVTVSQQDSVGLTLFQSAETARMPARSGLMHLRQIANTIADHSPVGDTNLVDTIHHLAESVRRRALIVIFSDGYDDLGRLRKAMAHFRQRKHDVVIYQILDPAELDFPFMDIGNFEDLETGERLISHPREIKEAYQQAIGGFIRELQGICAGFEFEHHVVTTDRDLVPLVREHLRKRQRS